jgi:TatD DNase family protein
MLALGPATNTKRLCMYTDSHCHLDFPELQQNYADVLAAMRSARVDRALCICTTLEGFDAVHRLALQGAQPTAPWLWATVGVHPDNEGVREPTVADLTERAALARVVAIGETGLDYYRLGERTVADMEWQRQRFRVHIRAARQTGLPLVIHTRSASDDTLAILREEGGFTSAAAGDGRGSVTGVFHCFTETREVARAALDMGFYISFSGILTFKNAADLRDVARYVPLERCLIETDSPYLAPVPHRGKTNTPAFVPLVAAQLAELKGVPVETVAAATSDNFERLFLQPVSTPPLEKA